MKKLFIILILLSPLYAQAVNYLGFGGGNYVYAEQGNLYFNLDANAFDNRKWSYDGEKFTSQISIKMDLKTKYTSADWVELVIANKKSDGLMYANYIKQPFNYQNRGGYQKVFWQRYAAAAVGGQIVRTASFGAIREFIKKKFPTFAATVIGSYFVSLGVSDGVECITGECIKNITYSYIASNTGTVLFKDRPQATKSEYENNVSAALQRSAHMRYTMSDGKYYVFDSCKHISTGRGSCTWKQYYPNGTFIADSTNEVGFVKGQDVTVEKILSDPEIDYYLDQTCKLFASECVNEPTNGKNINDVQLTAGSISGGVNVTGPPYTNPITGEAQQDKVVIGGTSSGIGVNSGTNSAWEYSPSLGQSTTNNTVDVTTTARPDLTNTGTADVAKPNNQTGTKPEVIVPPVTVPEFTDLNDMIDFCKANPKATSCLEFEEVEKQNDKELPEIQETFNLNKINIFASNGLCPQGSQFTLGFLGTSKTFELSFQPACDFAQKLRYVLIAIAMLIAMKIVFGFGGVKK